MNVNVVATHTFVPTTPPPPLACQVTVDQCTATRAAVQEVGDEVRVDTPPPPPPPPTHTHHSLHHPTEKRLFVGFSGACGRQLNAD